MLKCSSVFKIINLKGIQSLGCNKDICDWLEAGYTKEDLYNCFERSLDLKNRNELQQDKDGIYMSKYKKNEDGDKELVKDCVQDVFIKLISKSQDLQVTKVTSYLLISLRNRLLDEFRRKNYMTETAVEDIRISSTTVEDVENSYILDESSLNNVRKVQILMDELTPRQRQVFTLYYIEQRKYEDICDIMQMNYHSVRNLVHRGMLKLRAAVAV